MKLLMENLPPSLESRREVMERCLLAIGAALPVREIILFGSHARGDARPDSDVDLCIVSDEADNQIEAARRCRREMTPIRSKLAFTLIPISPDRLEEKRAIEDFFFMTVLGEGVRLAS